MSSKVMLKVVEGPLRGKSFLFEQHDHFIVGRSRSCHLHLPNDSFMSRHHFLLEVNPPEARIRDLGSMNGTFVNGKKCGGRNQFDSAERGAEYEFPQVKLQDSDRIQVGETAIVVTIERPQVVPTAIRCTACGRITSELEYSEHGGGYICKWCWAKIVENPMPVLGAGAEMAYRVFGKRQLFSLNDYEIVRLIGLGSRAAVHLVRHRATGVLGAMKVMVSKAVVDDEARESFLTEMENLCRLSHPSVASYRGAGSSGGVFFILAEYCDGGSVLQLMNNSGGRLEYEIAYPLMLDALDGLSYLHTNNVVHRDIKPHNLLLYQSGSRLAAKLVDACLARSFDRAGFGGLSTTGAYGDTFYPYMPREQLTDYTRVNPLSDVWSLAATFYHMLTGFCPRQSAGMRDPLQVVLDGQIVPIKSRAPHVPPPLADVLDHALSLDPSQRYPSADAFKAELKNALG